MKKSLSLAVLAFVNLPILFTATSSNASDFDYGYADLVYVRGDFKDTSLVGGKAKLDGFAVELSDEYSQYQVAADLPSGASLSLPDGDEVAVFLRKDLF